MPASNGPPPQGRVRNVVTILQYAVESGVAAIRHAFVDAKQMDFDRVALWGLMGVAVPLTMSTLLNCGKCGFVWLTVDALVLAALVYKVNTSPLCFICTKSLFHSWSLIFLPISLPLSLSFVYVCVYLLTVVHVCLYG